MANSPEQFENRDNVEAAKSPESKPEQSIEKREQQDYQAAGMLEEPKSGSFLTTLQLFVDWVKSQID